MDRYRVKPGSKVKLSDQDPDDTKLFPGDKQAATVILDHLTSELESLQEVLIAEHKHKILIVVQAMDTGGKDGVIKHVFEGVNPAGVSVASFKIPTAEELDHDFLWRIHKRVPGKGEIVIFNRSHYEDVLVVRVHKLVPEEIWRSRFDQINEFERMLADTGTTILKFFLNISFDEQRQRLQDRIDHPEKNWKFNAGDLDERKLWPDYMKAYEDVLEKTSTDAAPWYIVPSNAKWYRNFVISTVLVETLKGLAMEYPPPAAGIAGTKVE